jgi:hypothetical protein
MSINTVTIWIPCFWICPSGVIFVYDLSQRKSKTNLSKWAVEVAETGTFLAPLGSGGPGGLPVPYLVIANKVDIVPRDGTKASSGNLVDLARQWAEKQGLLRCSEELPLTESFPGNSGLLSVRSLYCPTPISRYCAYLTWCSTMYLLIPGCQTSKIWQRSSDQVFPCGLFRRVSFISFLCSMNFTLLMLNCIFQLIRRRYFSNEPPAPSPWSLTPREDTILPVETLGGGTDSFQRKRWACLTWKRPP